MEHADVSDPHCTSTFLYHFFMPFIRSNSFNMIQVALNAKARAVFDTSFDKTVVLFDDAVVIVHFPLALTCGSR